MKKDFKTKTLLFLEKSNHPSEETENLGRKQLNRMRWLKINKDTNLKIPHLPYLSIPWKKSDASDQKTLSCHHNHRQITCLDLGCQKTRVDYVIYLV